MSDIYYSIQSPAQSEYKEKGSKFLAFAYPVTSEEEIKQILKELKEKYWDASHHCYAYILGPKSDLFRANDAGEPNHSAGDPILSQIRSLMLTDTLVVVVRYFGGTKLGVSGLISAYKTAARQALIEAQVEERFIVIDLEITFGFEQMSWVMKCIKNVVGEIVGQIFNEESLSNTIKVKVRESLVAGFIDNLHGSQGIEIARRS